MQACIKLCTLSINHTLPTGAQHSAPQTLIDCKLQHNLWHIPKHRWDKTSIKPPHSFCFQQLRDCRGPVRVQVSLHAVADCVGWNPDDCRRERADCARHKVVQWLWDQVGALNAGLGVCTAVPASSRDFIIKMQRTDRSGFMYESSW